jgi:hypothetical protein
VCEPEEFVLEAAAAPGRVFGCQAQDQVAEFVTDWWAVRLTASRPADLAAQHSDFVAQERISTSLAAALAVAI